MPEAIVCPHCGKRYAPKPGLAGRSVACAACGQSFVVELPQPATTPPRATFGPPPPASPKSPAAGNILSTLDAAYPARGPATSSRERPREAPVQPAAPSSLHVNLLAGGLALVIVAYFALLLPQVGLQFRLLSWVGSGVPILAGLAVVLGAAGIFWALRSRLALAAGVAVGAVVVFLLVFLASPYARTQVVPPLAVAPAPPPLVAQQPDPSLPATPAPDPAVAANIARAEALAKQTAAKLQELQTALVGAADPLHADQALDRTTQILTEIQQLQREAEAVLGQLPPAERQRLETQFGGQLAGQAFSLAPDLARMASVPEAGAFLDGLAQPQASAAPVGGISRDSLVAQYGADRVATVRVYRVPSGLANYLFQRIPELAGAKAHSSQCRDDELTSVLAPVDDLPAFASRIDFGQVTRLDPTGRVVEVTADPKRMPAALPAEVDNPRAPDFYSQNVADLTCWDARRRTAALERLAKAEPNEAFRAQVVEAARGRLVDADARVRRASLEALGQWGGPDVIPELIGGLRDSDVWTRDAALRALGHFRDEQAIRAIGQHLADRPQAAREALAAIGPSAETILLEYATAGDDRAAAEAVRALGEIGTAHCRATLQQLADGPRLAVAAAAREALGKLAAREASGTLGVSSGEVDALLQRLHDPSSHEVAKAAKLLAEMPPDEARRGEVSQALLEVLAGTEHFSRRAAAQAMGTWYTPQSVPAMIGYTEDDNVFVRHEILRSLGKVQTAEAAEAVAKRLVERSDRAVAAEALRELGPLAEKPVQAYLADPDQFVRVQASEILGQIGTSESLPKLQAVIDAGGLEAVAARKAVESIQSRQ